MKNDENSVNLSRRDFFKELGMIGGGGVLLSAFPWLQSCSADDKVQIAKEKVRIGFIGTGSRGQYHLNNLKTIPYADVVALCDNYPPHLKEASALYPKAKTCFPACKASIVICACSYSGVAIMTACISLSSKSFR